MSSYSLNEASVTFALAKNPVIHDIIEKDKLVNKILHIFLT